MTYKTYLLNSEIKKYASYIEIVKEEKMDLGSMVTFKCSDKAVLDEIFEEE